MADEISCVICRMTSERCKEGCVKDAQAKFLRAAIPYVGPFCSYPECECPFDAPADPKWCARGYPHKSRNKPA